MCVFFFAMEMSNRSAIILRERSWIDRERRRNVFVNAFRFLGELMRSNWPFSVAEMRVRFDSNWLIRYFFGDEGGNRRCREDN